MNNRHAHGALIIFQTVLQDKTNFLNKNVKFLAWFRVKKLGTTKLSTVTVKNAHTMQRTSRVQHVFNQTLIYLFLGKLYP